jgi:hypothetical protein
MAFPLKYRRLLETKPGDVPTPSIAWLSYAVCGAKNKSCGWQGWIIESVQDSTGQQLPAATEQICEHCGKTLFRTSVALKLVPDSDQTPTLAEGRDYVALPMKYK